MDTVRVRPLRPYEQKKLQRMKRQKTNAVNRCHARILLLSRGGQRNRAIAERVDCSPQWVRALIHRFNAQGLDGIAWYPWMHADHRPRRFPADVLEQIAEVALCSPRALTGMTHWSLTKLRDYLVEQQIVTSISPQWLGVLLHRAKIRWRHTKTWKESTDPDFRTRYKRIRRLYQRRPANGRRICVDEFGPLNLLPRHGRCFAGLGKRVERHRATYHRQGGVRHFLAAYDLETDRLFGIFRKRKTAVQWLQLLKWLRARYPGGQRLHVVMDNASAHLTEEVLCYLWTHNIRLYLTPTNASWLNRIESQFTALKEFALNNSDYKSHEEQIEAILSYLDWRNRKRGIDLQDWKEYKRLQTASAS
jgi:transposase